MRRNSLRELSEIEKDQTDGDYRCRRSEAAPIRLLLGQRAFLNTRNFTKQGTQYQSHIAQTFYQERSHYINSLCIFRRESPRLGGSVQQILLASYSTSNPIIPPSIWQNKPHTRTMTSYEEARGEMVLLAPSQGLSHLIGNQSDNKAHEIATAP